MRKLLIALCCLFLIVSSALAQSDRGSITGTVTDPAGAMVPNAAIEAKNVNTSAAYQAASSGTGNYVLAQLPAGPYQLTVTAPGFKQYERTGLTVMVAQALRIDVKLEVGAPSEVVSVSAEAPLLKTESGELSHNISTEKLDSLPMLSATGMRDPFAAINLMPGVDGSAGSGSMRVNGMPGYTMSLRIDGQDATQNIWTLAYNMSTPSVDAVEETAVQTSNYAAEYGQAGGGILNMTMRSGTNRLHGSAFEYFRNEVLNAQRPYMNYDYKVPGYSKPRDRQNDFGFNGGGPVYIPKLYDGRDKTFFFYSFEQNRLTVQNSATYTLPSAPLQRGDFRGLLGAAMSNVCYDPSDPSTCGKDPLGNALIEGTIYDPSTETTVQRPVNGVMTSFVVRMPFMGCDGLTRNQICMSTAALDPVAMNYQALYPTLTKPDSLTDNYTVTWPRNSLQTINAFKIDHNISSKFKISGFYSYNSQDFDTFTDGLEVPLSSGRTMTEKSHTVRVTADYTISPTILLHLGAGLMHFIFKDPQPNVNYDVYGELGLPGTYSTVAPSISMSPNTSRGGLRDTGPVAYGNTWQIKPTGTVSLAWVKGNHNMKFGGELRVESHPSTVITPSNGKFIFDPLQTSLPYLGTSGNIGHPYASFLLGMYNKGEIGLPNRFHLGKHALAFYAQDSWKITSKITLDYGLRWDYQTYLQETEGRMPTFSPTALNPNYDNIPGDAIFKKDIANVYPHAWGPRIGLAYQFMPKTVLRAGFGISYGQTGALEMWNLRMGSFVRFGPNPQGYDAIGLLQLGPSAWNETSNTYEPVVPVWPNFAPGQAPASPQSDYMPWIHEEAGRPPRQMHWSIGIQREVLPNLLVDIAYVGNRGIWWNSNGAINDPNRVTPSVLEAHHFDLNNYTDRALLLKQWSAVSPAEMSAYHLTLPYSGFTGTVNQSLRPFPHVGNIFQIWAPLGKTWYDSMQLKVTQRFSHGLDFSLAYSWQKEQTIGAETNDTAFVTPAAVNNINDFKSNKTISGLSIPHRVVLAANYLVPKWDTNKFVSYILRDWTVGAMLTYASGLPIMAPRANWISNPGHDVGTLMKLCSGMGVFGGCNGSLFNSGSPASYASRVEGKDLFLVDPNESFDPRKNFMLNMNAWTNPPEGQYGTGAPYYSDYRYRRRPSENFSIGRNFPVREGMNLAIRVELMNIFNRVQTPNPGVDYNSNSINWGQVSAPDGTAIFGFGQPGSPAAPIADTAGMRTGQIVARFTF